MKSSTPSVPSWAAPASGESRLEPVGCGKRNHSSINLAGKTVTTIGRSPSNDLVLYSQTSSRHHAVVFHHPSGACFVMDCRSVHGTFVNGKSLKPNVPERVRRGSIIRFGCPESHAPEFVLKSFVSKFDKTVQDLYSIANAFNNDGIQSKDVAALQEQAKRHEVACVRGECGMVCLTETPGDTARGALVLLNTRVNACGGYENLDTRSRHIAWNARYRFENFLERSVESDVSGRKRGRSEIEQADYTTPSKLLCTSSPRSILSTSRSETYSMASNSPMTFSPVQGLNTKVRRRRVYFSDETQLDLFPAPVTPEVVTSESEAEDDASVEITGPVGSTLSA